MEAEKDMEEAGCGRKHQSWFKFGGCTELINVDQFVTRLR